MRIGRLVEAESFERALRVLDRLQRIDLDRGSRVRAQIYRMECCLELRRFPQMGEILALLRHERLSPLERLEIDVLAGHRLALSGSAREALRGVIPVLRRREKAATELQARARWVAGLALYRAGHYSWAAEFFNSSAAYYRLTNHRLNLARVLHNLGLVAKSEGRIDVALAHFDAAIRLLPATGTTTTRFRMLLDRGICLFKLGRLEKARTCFLQVQSFARSSGNTHAMGLASSNLGHIYRAEGNYDTAKEFYAEALAIAESLGAERKICLSLEFLGEACLEEGRLEDALAHLDRAHALASRLAGRGDLMMEVLRRRGEVYAAMGDGPSAVRDLERAIRLCRSRGERREQVLAERAHAFLVEQDEARLADRLQQVLAQLAVLGDQFEYARTVCMALEQGRLAGERHGWLVDAGATAVHYFNSLGSRTWKQRLQALLGHYHEVEPAAQSPDPHQAHQVATQSPAYSRTLVDVRTAARGHDPVLILGETGSGKEVVARLVHDWGARARAPLLAINCGAIPESLVESELFGHARGAFTGAEKEKVGLFEAAEGGSVLLDEVADLPEHLQTKLLRFIDSGELRPVGDWRARSVDVRVLAATNKDVDALVEAGRFRRDLFFRLSVFRIEVPPLRQRREDILDLTDRFLREETDSSLQVRLSPALRSWLLTYDWPGNVRELRGLCHYLVARGWGKPEIDLCDLPPQVRRVRGQGPVDPELPLAPGDPLGRERHDLERRHLDDALQRSRGSVSGAARLLGVSRNTVYRRLRAHGPVATPTDPPRA